MKNWELILAAGVASFMDGMTTLWLMSIAGIEDRAQFEANPLLAQLIDYPNFFLCFKFMWPVVLLCLLNTLGERGEKWAGRLSWFAIVLYGGISLTSIVVGSNL